MKQKLTIHVSKHPQADSVVTCKNVTLREKLLNFIFGNKRRMTVLIPGDDVGEISICKSEKGESNNGKGKVTA